ncbi:hypothetical protein UFOVP256_27 [uncultured Caudovirales phage]|uniref:Uncharacterized protein n=1 Tax=uncultured Caudovirales phage TaxID=2100421 RepID=A0A6J5LL40_9CAUD|nr:hypothetical protein UFOVP256_27 [uncultured Caudovirales phage]
MKKELSPFERYMRNSLKKAKQKEDQKILDQMLVELKEKHEKEKSIEIQSLTKQLEKMRG